LQFRVAAAVPGGVAERHLRRSRSLQEEADVVLVGHADAAVHLDRFVGGEQERVGETRLGERDELRRLRAVLVDREARGITAERESSVSVKTFAARCLSAWNVPIKTPNCFRSSDTRASSRTRRASSRASPRRAPRCAVERAASSGPRDPPRRSRRLGDLDVLEANDRCAAAVDEPLRRDADAARLRSTRKSVKPSARRPFPTCVQRSPAGRRSAVRHEPLLAGETPLAALLLARVST